jgi:hypothetical protein
MAFEIVCDECGTRDRLGVDRTDWYDYPKDWGIGHGHHHKCPTCLPDLFCGFCLVGGEGPVIIDGVSGVPESACRDSGYSGGIGPRGFVCAACAERIAGPDWVEKGRAAIAAWEAAEREIDKKKKMLAGDSQAE